MRLTAITMPWASGEDYTFDLRLGEARRLQEKTGLGPPRILHNLQTDNWKVDDYRETILQGLLGGGTDADKARKLVRDWVDDRPARESILTAIAIIGSFILGAPEPKKEPAAETVNETAMAPAESTLPQSMEQAPQSDSILAL